MLVLVGVDEFVTDGLMPNGAFGSSTGAKPAAKADPIYPAKEKATLALKAYDYLKVDAGRISPYTAKWLKKTVGDIPAGFSIVDDDPRSVTLKTKAGEIAILFFPVGENPGRTPSEDQYEEVLKAGRKLKFSADLVIGISPWGMKAEHDFLTRAQGVFDCLLGGGEGPAFAQSINGVAPGVLWARSDVSGRAINVITIQELPPHGQPGNWLEGVTFKASLTYLEAKQTPDQGMVGIVGQPPK